MKTEREPEDWKEGRRLRAWDLVQEGWKQKDIAKALGVSKGAVSQWVKRAKVEGRDGLRRHPAAGPQPRLSVEQVKHLPALLDKGAEAFGFRGNVWTTARVAIVIKRECGVSYHAAHCSRILRAIHSSVQQPVQRASQRDEAAIKDWKDQWWPALKKRPKRKNAPSSLEMKRAFTCCPWLCGPLPLVERPRSCGSS